MGDGKTCKQVLTSFDDCAKSAPPPSPCTPQPPYFFIIIAVTESICDCKVKTELSVSDPNSVVNRRSWQLLAVMCATLPPINSRIYKYVQVHLKKCAMDTTTEEGKFARFCLKVSQPMLMSESKKWDTYACVVSFSRYVCLFLWRTMKCLNKNKREMEVTNEQWFWLCCFYKCNGISSSQYK